LELAPHVIVIFGATGDLARRKLLPGLLRLFQAGLMPEFRIIGVSQDVLDDTEFRSLCADACRQYARHAFEDDEWLQFSERLSYLPVAQAEEQLPEVAGAAAAELGPDARYLHYLSVPPAAAEEVIGLLDHCLLTERSGVIMEKPFGTDLESARALNETLHKVLREEQIFRIDHFLGKEAAQNILAFRFANGLFEPIWNRDHIDHIQIDVPETIGVGSRAAV
jgi:glucose-6-phosphate 1-dehydrogenase